MRTEETTGVRAEVVRRKAQEIRLNVLDMVYTVQSGHIGGSFSEAEIMAALYFDILNVRPTEPDWAARDRMVLSKGHACPGWYAALAMRGFFPLKTLKTLRQFGSILQGHPVIKTPGVDMSTGSLGLGFAAAVGLALDGKVRDADYSVFVVLGDGEVNEGVTWEAAQTASKYKLNNLVAVLDRNYVQNDGLSDEIMPIEPIDQKYRNFGWEVIRIDGHDPEAVLTALETGKAHADGPFLIVADTVKGKGVSFMEGDHYWHGKPPTEEQYNRAREELLATLTQDSDGAENLPAEGVGEQQNGSQGAPARDDSGSQRQRNRGGRS